ncbi:MAG: PorT family protein [Tannerellaceae bacterium]|nr:PorT family protein [Tannerellaceae bacterium]
MENVNPGAGNAQNFRILSKDKAEITVLGADGKILPNAVVTIYKKENNTRHPLSSAKSDAKGFCEIIIPDDDRSFWIVNHTEYEEQRIDAIKPGDRRTVTMIKIVHENRFHFGLVGGLSIAIQLSDSWLYEEDKPPQLGFARGLLLEYKFTKWLSFQPELLFVMKGAIGKAHTSDHYIDNGTGNYLSDVQVKDTMRINYFELLLNLVFNIPLKEDNIYLVVGGGYYLAYGVYEKLKFGPSKEGFSFDKDTEEIFSGDTKILNPFDQGINCLLGLRFKLGVDDSGLFIRAGYSYSLNNMAASKGERFASF